jgi:LysM repeat protein
LSMRLRVYLIVRLCLVGVITVCVMCGMCYGADVEDTGLEILRPKMNGPEVCRLQECLSSLGYPLGPVDGTYGPYTEEAVRIFQQNNGLVADGIAGPETLAKLLVCLEMYEEREYTVKAGDSVWDICRRFEVPMDAIVQLNNLSNPQRITVGQRLRIPVNGVTQAAPELISWERARYLYASIARVIDVKTGLSFCVKRRGGHFHADSEPLTSLDTQVMKRIYGGSWSWERRAIIVEVCGVRIAASMNGMPHGGQSVTNNGFNGHFCIHFLGSKLHKNGLVDASHQMMIKLAATY